MSFDYDVVIIGNTTEAIYAAKKAVLLQARVALVTQTKEIYPDGNVAIYNHCLSEITNSLARWQSNPWGIWQKTLAIPPVSLQEVKNYGDLVAEITIGDFANLAALGVDIVYGRGEFCRLPRQALIVGNRKLTSRNYLLAMGADYQVSDRYLARSAELNCLTPKDIWEKAIANIPHNLTILGCSDSESLELAQGLARSGKRVTYVTSSYDTLLPDWAIAASRLLQAQFAADNIEVILNAPLNDIRRLGDKTILQVGKIVLETEAVVFSERTHLNITGLNLEGVGVTGFMKRISVNEKLQTKNQNIYACGELVTQNRLSHVARHQVDIALKNMLSFPWFKTDYRYLPNIILTQPNIASIGLSNIPSQPQKSNLYLIQQHFKTIPAARVTGMTTGWCQCIIKPDGEIVGCTIVGDGSIEIINLIALMMRQKIKLTRNPIKGLLRQDIAYVDRSYSEILDRVAIAFHQQKIQCDRGLKQRLLTWFDWRK